MLLSEHSWRKGSGITTAKTDVCVMVLGDRISDPGSKLLPFGMLRTNTWRTLDHVAVGAV
jgi:hypothetical protein